jgi:hypothetical protein
MTWERMKRVNVSSFIANFCAGGKMFYLQTFSLSKKKSIFKFIFFWCFKKISTAVEVEASCWINWIKILLPALSKLQFAIITLEKQSKIRWHCSKLFFINCIKFVIFTRKTIQRQHKKTVCFCSPACPIGETVLSWNHFLFFRRV